MIFEESGKWTEIGVIERIKDRTSRIESSERALSRTVDAGLFSPITSSVFDRIDYFESTVDWEDHLARPEIRGFAGDEILLRRALGQLDDGRECLRVEGEYQVGTYGKKSG